MKVYWTAYYGKFRKSEYTFQGRNAKRDAYRLVKRKVQRMIERRLQRTNM